MTAQQRINKIEELEFWLKGNPKHSDYGTVLSDKLNLEKQHKKQLTNNQLMNE